MLTQPLASDRAEHRMLVDREGETVGLLDAIRSGQPALLLGERGSGRSSLLNHVSWQLAHGPEPRESVTLGGELADDAAQLLGVLVARVARLAAPQQSAGHWLADLQALAMPDGPFGQSVQPAVLTELVDLLSVQLAQLSRPACLIVDGVTPSVAHRLFGNLRDELWALPDTSWVITGERRARPLYLEPPADAFFTHTVMLEPFGEDDAAALLEAHGFALSVDDRVRALAAGQGNPRHLLTAAPSSRPDAMSRSRRRIRW